MAEDERCGVQYIGMLLLHSVGRMDGRLDTQPPKHAKIPAGPRMRTTTLYSSV